MNNGISILRHESAMHFCAVTFMNIKAIFRKLPVKTEHNAVTDDFGDDRGGGNYGDFFIAFNNGLVRYAPRKS